MNRWCWGPHLRPRQAQQKQSRISRAERLFNYDVIDSHAVGCNHGGIRYGALSSQRSHSNAYAVLSPLAATLLMAQTQSIIVTCTGFHAFGT